MHSETRLNVACLSIVASLQTAKDLLSHLLVRDPKQRLGSGEQDAEEIKAHPFFADMDWALLATGTMPPPWVPSVAGSLDTSQFDQEFTSMMPLSELHCLLEPFVLTLTSALWSFPPCSFSRRARRVLRLDG